MLTWRSLARFLTVVVFCGACRSAPEPAPAPPPAAVPVVTVAVIEMVGYELIPKTLSVKVGQTVRFRNRNSEDEVHSVRVTEVANSAQLFGVGAVPYGSSDHTFERPGFYTVACDIHPMMRADILVTEP
jgi:plastocyanin